MARISHEAVFPTSSFPFHTSLKYPRSHIIVVYSITMKPLNLFPVILMALCTGSFAHSITLTGSHDGSTAVPIDSQHILIAEDESNALKLYSSIQSGPALASFDMAPFLALKGKEIDLEASCLSPTNPRRVYWIGSMSNSKKGKIRPDRDRIFATDIQGKGTAIQVQMVQYYQGLRQHLMDWGDSHGYALTTKAAKGIEPKRIDGFNLEGLEFAPDQRTLLLGFRAPGVGKSSTYALVVPLLHFESWFATPSSKPPQFGKALEWDLGGRGIRSLGKNQQGEYLIVAGPADSTPDFALYTWNGDYHSQPILRQANLQGLAPEGIVRVPDSLQGAFQVQLLSDFGDSQNTRLDWVPVMALPTL